MSKSALAAFALAAGIALVGPAHAQRGGHQSDAQPAASTRAETQAKAQADRARDRMMVEREAFVPYPLSGGDAGAGE